MPVKYVVDLLILTHCVLYIAYACFVCNAFRRHVPRSVRGIFPDSTAFTPQSGDKFLFQGDHHHHHGLDPNTSTPCKFCISVVL